ncbi:hypothetical protein F4556_005079 [Kitasatospora gansuensis]|uniref:Uncharacterized protein n=1 Tax=Kitasatospora gansuensis TaxID=258050 RepID=A0A7W7WKB9_9ACTN|nr:hypothetical protein [Kitasatospora gansuensis]MBB4949544.1 hypothetical protein [Kitasatospora gansuensis]
MTDHHNAEPAPSDDDLLARLGFRALPVIQPVTSPHDDLLARLAHQALHGVRPASAVVGDIEIVMGPNHWAKAIEPYRDELYDTADSQDAASRVTPAAVRTQVPLADEVTLLRERIRDAVVSLENIHDRLIFDNPDAADAIAAVTCRLSPSGEEDSEHLEQGDAPGSQAPPPSCPLSGRNES